MTKVAFIGLGVMVYPMAGHLKAKGTRSRSTTAIPQGCQMGRTACGASAATPADAAKGQEIVFCCVGNDDDLRSVTLGEGVPSPAWRRGRSSSITHHGVRWRRPRARRGRHRRRLRLH